MRKILILLMLSIFFISIPCYAKHLHPEKEYQAKWCKAHNGITEYRLNDGSRVDCLTDKLAVEVDFAQKWHECIGQALYYAQKTKRVPACVLILENPEEDMRFVYKLRYTVYNKKKISEFRTFTVKPPEVTEWVMTDVSDGVY